MKTFIIVLAMVVAIQALTEEQKGKIIQDHKECSAVSGVGEDVIERARNGDFLDDPKFKEHLLCFSKKVGFQDDNGEFQLDVIKEKLNAEMNDLAVTNKLVEKCAVKLATPQETAFQSLKCYYDNTPKHISKIM